MDSGAVYRKQEENKKNEERKFRCLLFWKYFLKSHHISSHIQKNWISSDGLIAGYSTNPNRALLFLLEKSIIFSFFLENDVLGVGLGLRMYILFWKPPWNFSFLTLPLEIPDKTKFHPWKFCKSLLDILEIPRPKTKTPGNST